MANTDLDLFVPDRYDAIRQRVDASTLGGMIEPIEIALGHLGILSADIEAAGRGGFLILRGDSGSGKSTFLHTLPLFVGGVEVVAIGREEDIAARLASLGPAKTPLRICVLEGREALGEVKPETIEAGVHDINAFLRSAAGKATLIVWPVNTDEVEQSLITMAKKVGDDALLGVGDPSFKFTGPDKARFVEIANRTIALLNQGAGLHDLGVSPERAAELCEQANTIGRFLGLLRRELLKNKLSVEGFLKKEKCRLWVLVSAANEPDGDVDALTRGIFSSADVERLMDATSANIVAELKGHPEKLGILGTVMDARIFHLPALTALACARDYHDPKLKVLMETDGLSTKGNNEASARIASSSLGKALQGKTVGSKARGSKMGSNSEDAMKRLVTIAIDNDELVNRTVGEALIKAGLITSYKTEQDFGTGMARRTDLLCEHPDGPIRVEVMWRTKTGRAEIANYVLQKLFNYGRAIGFLKF